MNLDKWGIKDLWSEDELRCLCCGIDPQSDRQKYLSEINDAAEAIRRSVLAGALKCISPLDVTQGDKLYAHDRFFEVTEAVNWASSRFQKLPKFATVQKPLDLDETPLSTVERNILLTIIAALCKQQNIPYKTPAKAANLILDLVTRMGARVGETTIEKHLKRIPEALESRMK